MTCPNGRGATRRGAVGPAGLRAHHQRGGAANGVPPARTDSRFIRYDCALIAGRFDEPARRGDGELIGYLSDPANVAELMPVAIAVGMNERAVETAAPSFGFAFRAIQYGDAQSVPLAATPNAFPTGASSETTGARAV